MMQRPLSANERISWLQLARTPRVGAVTFARLIGRFGSAQGALEALPRLSRGHLTPAPRAAAEQELEAIAALDGQLLAWCEPDYPALLRHLSPPPPCLAVRGKLALLRRPCIALVGARDASAAGLRLAETFARDLSAAGITVVSGLARGVDGAAHRGSLASGTVAVLAGGLANPYPPQHLALHAQIAAQGLVVSEAPIGAIARARDFPRRNHIISGLSLGVVVVEAALRSGSLITARAAGEQGREVMAAPGSPLDPRARGTNALIKDGAALVETADDILAHIRAVPRPGWRWAEPPALLFDPEVESAPDPSLMERLAGLLSPTPIHVNELARTAGAAISEVSAALMELELEGRAASLPGGYAASSLAAF